MHTKLKSSTLDIILIILSLIQFSIIPDKIFLVYRYSVIMFELVKYIKCILPYKKILVALMAYAIVLSYSTIINTYSVTWMLSAFMLCLQYVALFSAFLGIVKKYGEDKFIRNLIKVFFLILLINDFLMLFVQYNFTNAEETYLIGSKFAVSYYHAFLSCLLYVRYRYSSKKCYAYVAIFYTMAIAAVIHCTTGVIIAISIFAMMLIPANFIRKILQRPWLFMAILIIENVLIWGKAKIFQHPFIQHLMIDIFHKSANMTGRSRLYAATINLVLKQPWLGYGHKTDIYRELFGYGNAQNGLFHIITQAGILGAVIYFGIVYLGLRQRGNRVTTKSYGLYMYLYGMLVGSAIEISLSTSFMFGVAVLYAINMNSGIKKCENTRMNESWNYDPV